MITTWNILVEYHTEYLGNNTLQILTPYVLYTQNIYYYTQDSYVTRQEHLLHFKQHNTSPTTS